MALNELTKEIHDNAVSHGWWDEPRNLLEIAALCHSELSEAVEEYRAGHPMVWANEDGKPEGIATEMADCLIAYWIGLAMRDWTRTRLCDKRWPIIVGGPTSTAKDAEHGLLRATEEEAN